MTTYLNFGEAGITRIDEDLVVNGSNEITTTREVRSGAHVDFFEEMECYYGVFSCLVTTCTHAGLHTGVDIAGNIFGVSTYTVTLDANSWNGDTVTIRYATDEITSDATVGDALHTNDGATDHLAICQINRALNRRGGMNPAMLGYTYDYEAMYNANLDSLNEGDLTDFCTIMSMDTANPSNSIGTCAFTPLAPFYPVYIRIECEPDKLGVSDMNDPAEFADYGLVLQILMDDFIVSYQPQSPFSLTSGSDYIDLALYNGVLTKAAFSQWSYQKPSAAYDTPIVLFSSDCIVWTIYLGMPFCNKFELKLKNYSEDAVDYNRVRVYVGAWYLDYEETF